MDAHGLMFGNPRPISIYAPCFTPAETPPCRLGRDRDPACREFWRHEGYPGDRAESRLLENRGHLAKEKKIFDFDSSVPTFYRPTGSEDSPHQISTGSPGHTSNKGSRARWAQAHGLSRGESGSFRSPNRSTSGQSQHRTHRSEP